MRGDQGPQLEAALMFPVVVGIRSRSYGETTLAILARAMEGSHSFMGSNEKLGKQRATAMAEEGDGSVGLCRQRAMVMAEEDGSAGQRKKGCTGTSCGRGGRWQCGVSRAEDSDDSRGWLQDLGGVVVEIDNRIITETSRIIALIPDDKNP
ncbi:hypothetical protein B296_00022380 [Ensete ventricosum]|uniref:Uncharacterized protein n=1 Tax=Ensete ventricosum TaxID=4639 RepID=A0A426YR07_ENSVE|nr:hypothetical protein B296_00022380 [Ensete ventricosum]